MGAARYVGRVGGLAIALGVGTAILTGQGVAHADDTDTSKPASTPAGTSTADTSAAGGAVSVDKHAAGKHRSTGGTSLADTVKGIAGRVSAEHDKRVAKAEQAAADEVSSQTDEQTGSGTPAASRRVDRRTHRHDAGSGAPSQGATIPAAPDAASQEPPRVTWSKNSRGVAGRDSGAGTVTTSNVTTASVTSTTVTSLSTSSTVGTHAPAMPTATPTAPVTVSTLLTSLRHAFDPLSSTGGTTPVGGSVADLVLLAGMRREQQALVLPGPTVTVTEGVIGGCVVGATCTTANGSTYTLVSAPNKGGKLALDATTGAFTFLPFAPETSANGPSGQESFSVLVAQNTNFTTFVTGLPIVGSTLIAPVIMTLQQHNILAPLIGTAARQDVTANIDDLRAPAGMPVAFTTMVTSWDGVQISTNFFPAITTNNPDLGALGYETIFNGPGLAQAGATNPNDPFVSTFRTAGYNVVTWDPRGEFDSGGVLQLDSPQYEGQDVSQLISWVAGLNGVQLDNPNDPTMGMVGVSYGGGIQLVTAASDDRVDAIAPGWAWNTLPESLYPDKAFKTAYSSLLLLGLVTAGARINPQIYGGILTGDTLGILTPRQIQLLQTSGPGQTVRGITAPTLFIQGTVDVLFPLEQALLNAALLPTTTPEKMLWFCGGHGSCLPGQGNGVADSIWVMGETVDWMNEWVKGEPPADPSTFEWTDQTGDRWTSNLLPTQAGFYDSTSSVPPTAWTTGKVLPIIPIVGGSGPGPYVPLPYSLGNGSVASNAVTIALNNPSTDANVVGAPHVVINYSGLGTSRHIYAQIVDKSTGLVVGNIVTPVPVTLNGRDQTATIDLNDIAYTVSPDSQLELQIFTTATSYLNLTQYGFVDIKGVQVTLPTTTQGTNVGPNVVPVGLVAV